MTEQRDERDDTAACPLCEYRARHGLNAAPVGDEADRIKGDRDLCSECAADILNPAEWLPDLGPGA